MEDNSLKEMSKDASVDPGFLRLLDCILFIERVLRLECVPTLAVDGRACAAAFVELSSGRTWSTGDGELGGEEAGDERGEDSNSEMGFVEAAAEGTLSAGSVVSPTSVVCAGLS